MYHQALTHKSFSQQQGNGAQSNERLEFLGDAVLGAVVADYLCTIFPDKTEGELTEIRAQVVKRDNLNRIALEMGIHELLIHETDSDLPSTSMAGNAFEALIGALYIDRGYKRTCKGIIHALVPTYIHPEEMGNWKKNAKSRILEWSQREKCAVQFRSKKQVTEDGKELFDVVVIVAGKVMGSATATSKKAAEFDAAHQALEKLEAKE
ncbi:MAG: ribonuclease III [Flavobacteriales bacterium]|nr:ribonuclease III [Flavobacteriales bacterium]MCB9449606.1 ribonuclease III [Flavobacteriales bacterium]